MLVLRRNMIKLECFIKLQMFRSLRRYSILEVTESRLTATKYYRCACKILDKTNGLIFAGMAEGEAPIIAKLRAISEAYERSCLWRIFDTKTNTIGRGMPYGAGVGFRKGMAIRRAYGEYYERYVLSRLDEYKTIPVGGRKVICHKTIWGPVFVAIIRGDTDALATGYGFTTYEALDSAFRSLVRKKDYPDNSRAFYKTYEVPKVSRITPEEGGWLECYFVGTV